MDVTVSPETLRRLREMLDATGGPTLTPPESGYLYGEACAMLEAGISADEVQRITGWDLHLHLASREPTPAPIAKTKHAAPIPRAAALTDPCPCDDCRHRERCTRTRETCAAFRLFFDGASHERWRLAPRQPGACAARY